MTEPLRTALDLITKPLQVDALMHAHLYFGSGILETEILDMLLPKSFEWAEYLFDKSPNDPYIQTLMAKLLLFSPHQESLQQAQFLLQQINEKVPLYAPAHIASASYHLTDGNLPQALKYIKTLIFWTKYGLFGIMCYL